MSKRQGRNLLTVAVQVALGLNLGLSAEIALAADSDDGKKSDTELGKISVDADDNAYKPEVVQSPKYTESLRDTAQTITVIPAQVIQEQGTLLLRDVLRENVPGITFGAGEGASYGDSINIRGFSATNDLAMDGVRQSANTTHSDPFNLASIEVVQGTSSVYSGVGALGGTINMVSKLPELSDYNHVSLGAGTADYLRGTADVNHRFGDPDQGMAFRVNVMGHKNQVADRDEVKYARWGIAPSVSWGLGTATSATLAWVHEHDNNFPEFGIPLRNYALVPGVARNENFGFSNTDVEKIDADDLTLLVNHEFNKDMSVRNLTRWEQYNRYSVVDAAEGRICLAPGQYPLGTNLQAPGAAVVCGGTNQNPAEGVGQITYTPSGPTGSLRDTHNHIIANQTDFTAHFKTGPIEHAVVVGAAVQRETYSQTTGGLYRDPDGSTYLFDVSNLYAPNHTYTQPLNTTVNGFAYSSVSDQAGYVFDTLHFNDQWLLGIGARYEHNRARYNSFVPTPAATLTSGPGPFVAAAANPALNDSNLLSYRGSLLYKPTENGSIYIAWGDSKLPSTSTVNGSCTVNCNVSPQIAKTYELGAKWDLIHNRLAVTGAVFRTDRTNYLVASGDPTVPSQQLDGKARVDGVQFGLTGNITEQWAVFANYAHLRSEVLRSVSAFTLAATGIDAQAGNPLANTPPNSANIWTTYRVMRPLTVGYGANYTSYVYATANNYTPTTIYARATIPGFVVHNVMATWTFNKQLNVQVNVSNLFDKEYFTQLRSVSTTSGWVNPGAGRTATIAANFSF